MSRPALTVTVLTAFPGLLELPFHEGILERARKAGRIDARAVDLRQFAQDRHRTLDDTPYGGGAGMLLMAPPILEALAACEAKDSRPGLLRVLLAPDGVRFDQSLARTWSRSVDHLVLLSGRYEGIDERVRAHMDLTVSLGDFVLMGGEAAAWAITEAVVRLVPGVVEARSLEEESFQQGRLEGPQYTRPPILDGTGYGALADREGTPPRNQITEGGDIRSVPDVLRSGDHGRVARAERRAAFARTLIARPDLLRHAALADDDATSLGEVLQTIGRGLSEAKEAERLSEGLEPVSRDGSVERSRQQIVSDAWAARMLY